MFETKDESPLESPLQNMLLSAWWIKKMDKFLKDFDKDNPCTTHDSVQSAANEEN